MAQGRFGVKEVVDGTWYDLRTGKPALFVDSLKLSNLENEAETSYATGGRGNPRRISWDYSRTPVYNVQDALMNPKALSMLVGNELKEGKTQVHKREVKVASEGEEGTTVITLAHEPIEGTITAFKTGTGYEFAEGDEVTGESTSTELVFQAEDVPAGENVVVFYEFETDEKAFEITMTADKFPGFYKFVGDTIVRNEVTGQDEPFQIIIPKAKIQPNFTITMEADGDPSVFDFNMDIFQADDSTDMVRMIKY